MPNSKVHEQMQKVDELKDKHVWVALAALMDPNACHLDKIKTHKVAALVQRRLKSAGRLRAGCFGVLRNCSCRKHWQHVRPKPAWVP
jgi:hypothetical protein